MFTCGLCKETIGPRVKPIRVITQTRGQQYHNEFTREDEWGNREKVKVDSQGHEIVSEMLLCPDDARANGVYVHEQQLPLPIRIGAVFQEKLPEPLHPKLIALAVHNALDVAKRDQQGKASKREQRDIAVSIPIIKWFSDHNKNFTF